MTYSRKKEAVSDLDLAASLPNQAQEVGAITNLDPENMASAPLQPLKKNGINEVFEDVRGYRRIRIYTSLILQVPEEIRPHTFLVCPFQILDCEEAFNDIILWKTHIFWHFRRHVCPRTASCFLCERVFDQSPFDDPARAWNEMLSHMVIKHSRVIGQRLATVRTDFTLMRWMYNRRIITVTQFRSIQLLSIPTTLAESTGEVVNMPKASIAPSPTPSLSPPVK